MGWSPVLNGISNGIIMVLSICMFLFWVTHNLLYLNLFNLSKDYNYNKYTTTSEKKKNGRSV